MLSPSVQGGSRLVDSADRTEAAEQYRSIITELVGVQQNALLPLQAALTVQHALALQPSVVAIMIPTSQPMTWLSPFFVITNGICRQAGTEKASSHSF